MSAPVFLAETALDAYPVGATYLLDGAEGRHAGVVQRRGPGERIDVVDGRGTRLVCAVENVDGARVRLRVDAVHHEPARPVEIVLVQALAKGDRDELAIEAATEVGVDGVVPWQAERSVVVWRGERAARSRARWVATVRAAAKQSRRSRVPLVAEPVDTRGLGALIERATAAGGRAFVLHEEATVGLVAALGAASGTLGAPPRGSNEAAVQEAAPTNVSAGERALTGDGSPVGAGGPQVLLVVGPEGGIGAGELAALVSAGAVPVRLGPYVLRTSTAGPVAAAIVAERLGYWEPAGDAGTLDA